MSQNKNKGLGRGLASLMGINEIDFNQTTLKQASQDISTPNPNDGAPIELEIDLIDPNSQQPRKNFDQELLNELAESIKIHGVIQPIIVTKMGERFMIIAGERRFRASKLLNLTTIPAIIRNYNAQQIKEISLIENLQRDDLNAIETAKAIKMLMDSFNMTQEVAADRLGKSRSYVANTLRLLNLDSTVIALIEEGKLSAGHGRTLAVLTNVSQQRAVAQKALAANWNVREIEKAVRDIQNPPQKEVKPKETCLELHNLVDNMQRTFATKITAIGNQNKGRICIDYFTKDDLDRICELVEQWMEKYNQE